MPRSSVVNTGETDFFMDCLKKNKIELNILRPSLVYNSYIFGEKLIYLWQNTPISFENDSYIFDSKLMNP